MSTTRITESSASRFLAAYGRPDVITGGIPCQPASLLGTRRGTADERWLWPHAIRVVSLLRPRFALFENPPALLTLEAGGAFNGITSALAEIGYDCWWEVVPASIFGAGHLRERLLIIAADASSFTERGQTAQPIAIAIAGTGEARQKLGGNGDANLEGEQMGYAGQSRQHGDVEPADGHQCEDRQRAGARSIADEQNNRESSADQTRRSLETQPVIADSNGSGKGTERRLRQRSNPNVEGVSASDSGSKGFQGHAGNGPDSQGWTETRRPVAPPDLRGRVNRPDWWHQHVTGVPVLVHGVPSKLVEAYCRCSGNAVVPQVIQPFARAIAEAIEAQSTVLK